MNRNWTDNVAFILVEPSEQGNIGASARAMKNMGFQSLSLINPPAIDKEALSLAHGAEDVLTGALLFKDLREAIKEVSLVVGTSRRRGRKRGLFLTPWTAAQRIIEVAQKNRVAILFGRESRGLYNEEVNLCSLLIQIPSAPEQPSLNLAQSVMIIAYELLKASLDMAEGPTLPLASQGELDAILQRVHSALRLLGYMPKDNCDKGEKIILNIRRFLGRAGLTPWETKMLLGLCSNIEKRFGPS